MYQGWFAVFTGIDPNGEALLLVGQGGAAGGMFNLAAQTASGPGDTVLLTPTGNAFVDAIRQYAQRHGCVDRLMIFGHGSASGIYLFQGQGQNSFYSQEAAGQGANAANVGQLNPDWFCENATITIYACNTGNAAQLQEGQFPIAQLIANQTGAVTTGSTSGMSFTGVQGGQPGQGLPNPVPANYQGNVYLVPENGQMQQFQQRNR